MEKEKEAEARLEETVNNLLQRLKKEKEKLGRELSKEYEKTKIYINKNPERGALIAFLGGIVIGMFIRRR